MNRRMEQWQRRLLQAGSCGLLLLGLTACAGISRPSMPSVPSWVPVVGAERDSDSAAVDQSTQPVPVDVAEDDQPVVQPVVSTPAPAPAPAPVATSSQQGGLQPGTTMRVAIYEGLRSTSRVLNATLTVDDAGQVSHRRLGGEVMVLGMSTDEALGAIETAHRLAGRPSAQATTTHLLELNGVPVVQVKGAVGRENFLPRSDDLTLGEALQRSGGFGPGANPGKVYVIRRGKRELLYLSDEDTMTYRLNEGDILSVPWAL